MNGPPEIKHFEELIEPHLNGAKVKSYKTRYLTKVGDNYGSTMLGVTVHLEKPDGSNDEIELVAKSPPTAEFFWNLFQPEITCPKENGCYTHISPALLKLQKEANIPENQISNVFPKCFGARLSLEGGNKVDGNALLLLENLVVRGYKVGDRVKGFDYEHTSIILRDLAKFHACVVAERLLKPKEFDENFRPFLKKFNVELSFDEAARNSLRNAHAEELKTIFPNDKTLCDKVIKGLDVYDDYVQNKGPAQDGLYTTLGHFDFWVNNMLIQYDENGKPNNCKIVDYQVAQYDSFAHDLVFFLFTSVHIDLLKEKLNEFIDHYYNHFVAQLKLLSIPVENYTKETYLEEINRIAPIQLGHIMMMLKVLLAKMDNVSDMSEINHDMFTDNNNLHETFNVRVKDVALLFDKMRWLP